MFKAFGQNGNPFLSIYFLSCGLACGMAAAILFIRFLLPFICQMTVDKFLMPKCYLKDAAVLLSPIQGMIAAGQYEEAETALQVLQEKHPGDPEITLMLMNLYLEYDHDVPRAVQIAALYFQYSPKRRNELHIRILMEHADLLEGLGRMKEIQELFDSQLRHGNLTPSEIKSVTLRLNNTLMRKE